MQSSSKIGPSRRESSSTLTANPGCSNSQLAGCCYNEQNKYSLSACTAGGKHGHCSSVSVEVEGVGLQFICFAVVAKFLKCVHGVPIYI